PSAIMGILFDDYLDAYLQTPIVISIMLIFYGLLFILIENWNKKRTPTTMALSDRSEEHTSELQSRFDLVCRLLLEKKKHQEKTVIAVPRDTQRGRDPPRPSRATPTRIGRINRVRSRDNSSDNPQTSGSHDSTPGI